MKLTQNHIQELYKFTRKHYVEYYDVQSELVDHLANDIEEIWIENPNLSFEDARDKSFKKFGVFGFMNVVEQKQTQMTKRYFKIILKFIKEWFRLPKIVLTALLFLGFYQLQKLPNAYNMYIAVFIVVILLECYTIIKNSRKLKKKTNKTGKKWMFENIIAINGIGNSALILLYAFDFLFPDNAKDFLLMGDFRKALSAAIITLLILFGYVSLIVIPKKQKNYYKKRIQNINFHNLF